MKHFIKPVLFLITCTGFAMSNSHEFQEGPGEAIAQMMKKGEKFASPCQHHSVIGSLAGTWTTSSVVMGLEPQVGTSNNKMILGGRFLEMQYEGSFLGVELEGIVTLGFDNYKKKYTVVFIDNLNTSIRTAEGMLDKSGVVINLWGTMDEWLTDEHDKPVMYRYTIIDANNFSFEVHDLSLPLGYTKVIDVHYKRN